jgi:TrmH family RNA methyltransferase
LFALRKRFSVETITSVKDERIVLARAAGTRKGRLEHGKILLEGEEILDWAIGNGVQVEYVLLSDKSLPSIVGKYGSRGLEVYGASEGILKKVTGTNYLIPVIGVGKIPSTRRDMESDFVVVLDSVKDFGNIGTIVRTCRAFGVEKIMSTTTDFELYQRKTIEASRGSVFAARAECFRDPAETIEELKRRGYQIVATSPRGEGLQSLVELKRMPVALVVGNETMGISREFEEKADFLIQIPMHNAMESLNVGVAAGISVYELRLKQVLTMLEERIKSTLGRELNVASTLMQKAMDSELKKVTDLSSRQVIFMMVLKCDREMRIEDMSKQFGVLESEREGFLAPVMESGLVTLNDCLRITEKGEETLAKLWFVVERAEKKILSDLTVEQSSVLLKQLRLIQDRCVEMMEDGRKTKASPE